VDYIEEKTPSGYIIKVLLNKYQFLVFDSRGGSVFADSEGKSMVHTVPIFIFIGRFFRLLRDHERPYSLLKVRNESILLPYRDIRDKRKKYLFIEYDRDIELVPARLFHADDVPTMFREFDVNWRPEAVIVDDSVSESDIIIIKNRYKLNKIINADRVNNLQIIKEHKKQSFRERITNLNMMSDNPVFLTMIHLRDMNISLINQLLLDFDLSVLDTEYILKLIEHRMEEMREAERERERARLDDLRESFQFYRFLLNRNEEKVREIIDSHEDPKTLTPLRTLVTKARSIYPDREEQELYTRIDNYIVSKMEKSGEPLPGPEPSGLSPEQREEPEKVPEESREEEDEIPEIEEDTPADDNDLMSMT
jgi:hypothetical protein